MKQLKLTVDYEFNRLTKNCLADAYEKIIPQKQHQINLAKLSKNFDKKVYDVRS